MKTYSFTDNSGELFEVYKLGGYYQLYKNGEHTGVIVEDSLHHEEANSKLLQMYMDECNAELNH